MYKKYTKVKNRGFDISKMPHGFYVEEKLDGANASFTYDKFQDKLLAFSRNQQLAEGNTLNGFYGYVQDFWGRFGAAELNLLSRYTVFGEWLTKHTVTYKDDAYKKFYAFDVYDKEEDCYLSYGDKLEVIDALGLESVRLFNIYTPEDIKDKGVQKILEEIKSYSGLSLLTNAPDTGEGVVIKRLEGKAEEEEYFKLVTDRFRETKGTKKQPKPQGGQVHIVDYAITEPRLKKIIYKKLDAKELEEEDLSLQNFGKVMGTVAPDFMEDILEEEQDEIIKQIKKRIGKKLPEVLRPILAERDEVTNGF